MTNITELAQSLKRRATSANEFGESLYVKGADVIALVEALEKAQQHIARQEQILLNQDESLSIRRGELEAAHQRIAELESRAVTVKLPQAVSAGGQGYQGQVERILTAAGIKVEAE
ncbi:hypothetical protein MLJ92_003080 [Klebsiella pneumoniae]|nr:hypothetical protein [Klebsiella pneumoniae]